VGSTFGDSNGFEFRAVRLDADGSLDTTYGAGGTADLIVVEAGYPNENRRYRLRRDDAGRW
jgi:hypothetical protein